MSKSRKSPLSLYRGLLPSMLFTLLPFAALCAEIEWKAVTDAFCKEECEYKIEKISGGTTNQNFCVAVDGKKYFIRTPLSNDQELGADLSIEFEALLSLLPLHIAPRPHFFRSDRNILVTEYIEAKGDELDFSTTHGRRVVVDLLKTIHTSGIELSKSFDPFTTIEEHLHFLEKRGVPPEGEVIERIEEIVSDAKASGAFGKNSALCHHDLHPGNVIVSGERILLVDWEYAAMSDPLYDVASTCSTLFWNKGEMDKLLRDYAPNATQEECQRLYTLRKVADVRWYLWCEMQKELFPEEPCYKEWSHNFLSNFYRR